MKVALSIKVQALSTAPYCSSSLKKKKKGFTRLHKELRYGSAYVFMYIQGIKTLHFESLGILSHRTVAHPARIAFTGILEEPN